MNQYCYLTINNSFTLGPSQFLYTGSQYCRNQKLMQKSFSVLVCLKQWNVVFSLVADASLASVVTNVESEFRGVKLLEIKMIWCNCVLFLTFLGDQTCKYYKEYSEFEPVLDSFYIPSSLQSDLLISTSVRYCAKLCA